MKNIMIISASLRNGSNSEFLAEEFRKGAVEAKNNVEVISLKKKEITFCTGCLACQTTGMCVLKDNMDEILPKIAQADVIVFATPIYFYEMAGQLKTVLDRTNPLFVAEFPPKDIYILSTAAEDEESVPEKMISGIQGWIDCFDNIELKETLFVGGVTNAKEIESNIGLQKAFLLGKSIY